jgi:hypothetical protein
LSRIRRSYIDDDILHELCAAIGGLLHIVRIGDLLVL